MSLLEFQNVCYVKDNKTIVDDISVKIEQGDFITIVGPSGSGKSTFLKLCSHLISPTKGTMHFKGKDFLEISPTELRKKISYCFQAPYLFGDTVMDDINFPSYIRNEKIDQKRVNDLFAMFQMSPDYVNKDVRTLSGGERQRIALIRSLLYRPDILLLDEATSALDSENTKIVETVIHSLHKEGITVLWITHNPDQNRSYSNKKMSIAAGKIKSLEVLK